MTLEYIIFSRILVLNTRFFFYKHQRYKHREAQISPKCFDKINVPMYSASIFSEFI